MPEDRAKVLDLVSKLLALSKSPNEHEAARAAEKVQELLFKYKLSMAEVQAQKGDAKGPRIVELDGDIMSQKNWGKWKPQLAWGVARYNFCTGFQDTWRGKFIFIGQEIEAQTAKELYEWLVIQLEDVSRIACLHYQGPSRIPTFRRAFFTGAVLTVNNRLYNQWRNLQGQSEQSTALVVTTKAQLEQYKKERHPDLVKGKSTRMANGSYDGYHAGITAGKDIEITVRKKVKKGGGTLLE